MARGGTTMAAPPPTRAAPSRADGGFTISDLAPGTYVVRARAPDGAEAQVEGVSTGRTDVVLRLAAAGGIDGELVGFRFPPDVVVVQAGRPQARYRPELD